MGIPYRFDDHVTERSMADSLLAQLGITEAVMRERAANRGDASKGLTGIGDAGPVSGNPMQISGPLPKFDQPDTGAPDASKVATVPIPNLNAMKVAATPNYIQPNVITPPARATTTATVRNPMGL